MENNEIIWRKISGYKDYEISSDGRVKSLKFGKVKTLKGCPDQDGYLGVYLCRLGKIKRIKIARLVASHFVENPQNLSVVNHKNGNKTDDFYGNLEWCSATQNTKHALEIGLTNNKGENNPSAKLTDDKVMSIRGLYLSGKFSQRKLAQVFMVSQRTILRVVNGTSWRNLLCQ